MIGESWGQLDAMAAPAVGILFAHGAGLSSQSAWMKGWSGRLARVGHVRTFDYPYMQAGRRRPDHHDVLVQAHRESLTALRATEPRTIVLAGKSMGSRMGCHVTLVESVSCVVCFGYPLVNNGAVRDAILKEMRTPILFIQGTRDSLCPLEMLQRVRSHMQAPNELHVVADGDHSLLVTKTALKRGGFDQNDVDEKILSAIEQFVRRHATSESPCR